MILYNIERRERSLSHVIKRKPNKGSFKKGMVVYSKNKTHFDDNRIPHGETHGMWSNNSTLNNYGKHGVRLKNYYKEKKWREDVFERDNYTCQKCNNYGVELNSHHIKSWINYPELRYDINNGETLCIKCHHSTHKSKSSLL
jgi:hypothetical protein